MGFLVFILFLFLFLVMLGLSIIGNLFRAIFGIGRRAAPSDRQHHSSNTTAEQRSSSAPPKKKIFDKADGEYIDFEEIKD